MSSSTITYWPDKDSRLSETVIAAAERDGNTPLGVGISALTGASRYIVGMLIGKGGMGDVFCAQDIVLDRRVAFKVLRSEFAERPEHINRMKHESRISARLEHSGMVPVHDVGTTLDGRPFIAMKLIDGDTFSTVLKEHSRELDWCLNVFARVCDAVAYAHNLEPQILHCDLKPANIMVTRAGDEVHTLDWGLARFGYEDSLAGLRVGQSGSAGDNSTMGRGGGTPAYMSPEQARGETDRLGPPTDVFSLGIILLEIIRRELHLPKGTSQVEARRLAQGPGLPSLWKTVDDCEADEELKQIVRNCLAAAPEDRYANAGELSASLKKYQRGIYDRLEQARLDQARSETRRKGQLLAGGILATSVIVGLFVWRSSENAALQRRNANNLQGSSFLTRFAEARSESEAFKKDSNLRDSNVVLQKMRAARDELEPLTANREIDDSIREELIRASNEIDLTLAQIRGQEALLSRVQAAAALVGARIDGFVVDDSHAVDAFRSAFHDSGIAIDLQPTEAAERLLGGLPASVQAEVVAGLDIWSWISLTDRPKIQSLVARIDRAPDRWRPKLREAATNGDRESLERLAREAAAEKPSTTSLRLLAVALLRVGGVQAAIDMLREGLFDHPHDFWLHFELARSLERQFPQHGDEIVAAYGTAVAIEEKNALAWMGWGANLAATGRHKEADRCYERALERAPENRWISLNQASVNITRRDPKGLEQLRVLHLHSPKSADIAAVLARNVVFLPRGLREAKGLLAEARQLDPNCSQIPFSDAMVAMAEKRYGDYLDGIRRLRHFDPGEQNLVRAECLGLVTVGNYEDAENLARSSLASGLLPAHSAATYMELLAYSLILQGRPAEAEQWARQAIDRHAVSKVNLDGKQQTLLFQSLMQQGRFDEALSVRPPPSEGSNPLGSTAGALALVVADPMLRRYSRIKAIIEEGDFKKWSSFDRLDQTVLPEVALACGFPRFAFRQYHAYIGQGRVPVLENMVANASSPLWVNEFYQITMRLNAARAAVRAADDPMREPANISPEDRKLARQQGLAWLRLELDSLQRRANQRSEQTRANGILSFLQRCPDFASVREAPSLVKMPEDDRRNWDEFWAKVDALRTTVRYRDPPG